MENPKLATGAIEVYVTEFKLLNTAKTPPFPIEDRVDVSENLRLKYRFLDLRRKAMADNLDPPPHRVPRACAAIWTSSGFLEIETPVLTKITPEGARDFLVPSRVNQGQFYALPQSPQLFKQLLMCRRHGPLLPDRQMLPRRGPARRPPARVHPDRHRDVLRHEEDRSWKWPRA
jgi:aspartyl-tRNA synthetase